MDGKSSATKNTFSAQISASLPIDPMSSLEERLRAASRGCDWSLVAQYATATENEGDKAFRKNYGGYTLLHLGAIAGATEACKALLTTGLDIDSVDAKGCTALHMAAAGGHASTVQVLLDGGASITRNKANKTPLHDATWSGHKSVVEILVPHAKEAGLLNATGHDGRAAIHCASLSRDPVFVETLLNAGANADIIDKQGRTPLDWASHLTKASGDGKVEEKLIRSGARSSDDLIAVADAN